MIELQNFTDKGNGTYAAVFGHDDMVMAEMQLTFATETLQYKLLKNEFEESGNFSNSNKFYNPFEAFDNNLSRFDNSSRFDNYLDYFENNDEINFRNRLN